jgi:ABC-type transport system substrate-binding protein
MKKKILAIALAMLMVVSVLAACSSKTTDSTDKSTSSSTDSNSSDSAELGSDIVTTTVSKDEVDPSTYTKDDGRTFIRVASDADPATLDPFDSGSASGKNQTITHIVWEKMAVQTPDAEYQFIGVESYELNEELSTADADVFNVTIRSGIHDSEGNQITASDIAFDIQKHREAGSASSLKNLDHVEVIDDYNMIFYLKVSQVYDIESIFTGIIMVSEKAYEECGGTMATTPIATGPYIVTNWVTGSSLTLEKNENYWANEVGYEHRYSAQNVDIVEYQLIKEGAQQTIALETDVVDLVGDLNSTNAQNFMDGSAGINIIPNTSCMAQTLFLNGSSDSICGDENLRKAIMYSLDPEGLIDGAMDGYGVRLYSFGERGAIGYNEDWETYEGNYDYDTSLAKEYLEKSSYDGSKIRIMCNNSDMKQKLAQVIQGYLSAVGIDSEILAYEDALFTTYRFDSLQWDIELDNTVANTVLIDIWSRKYDLRNFDTGANAMCVNDDELQQLMVTALSRETNSQEAVDAVQYWVTDHAVSFGTFATVQLTAARADKVVETTYNNMSFLTPTTCTYIWND